MAATTPAARRPACPPPGGRQPRRHRRRRRLLPELPCSSSRGPGQLLAALLLAAWPHFASAAAPVADADELLARYAATVAREASGAEIRAATAEYEHARRLLLPRVRAGQSAGISFGGDWSLGANLSLSVPLLDAEAELEPELARLRLELAEHNQEAERRSRIAAFARSLRLHAHLEEVEEVLTGELALLLALRPQWSELPDPWEEAAGNDDPLFRVYLELLQALGRTRSDRQLLALQLAREAGLPQLPRPLGRPAVPASAEPYRQCRSEGAETVRAGLLLEEEKLLGRIELARGRPAVSLELGGNASYRGGAEVPPDFGLGASVALQVALPTASGVASNLSLGIGGYGLSQSSSLSWPASRGVRPGGGELERARRAYEDALAADRLGVLAAFAGAQSADQELRLQRLESGPLLEAAAAPGQAEPERLARRAQVRVNLLVAELELDLALLDLAARCDGA